MHAHNGANIQPTLSEQCPTCNKGYRTMSACTYVFLRLRQPGHALSTYCNARFCAPTMLLYTYTDMHAWHVRVGLLDSQYNHSF